MSSTTRADRLFDLFIEEAKTWTFDSTCLSGGETQFTGEQVYPRLKKFIESLKHRSLIVRADKNSPPRSLSLHGLTFVPDVEVVEFSDRHLAIEVKFLRDADPSGSLAKAIGQGLLYKSLGFAYSHLLVIDCRKNSRQLWMANSPIEGKLPRGLSISVYSAATPFGVSLSATF
jgi:hypothetical protein